MNLEKKTAELANAAGNKSVEVAKVTATKTTEAAKKAKGGVIKSKDAVMDKITDEVIKV